jgi:hypothetical protein
VIKGIPGFGPGSLFLARRQKNEVKTCFPGIKRLKKGRQGSQGAFINRSLSAQKKAIVKMKIHIIINYMLYVSEKS